MEEQRQRQEEEQRRAQAESVQETDPAGQAPATPATAAPTSDEAMLERALALSTETPVKRHRVRFVSVLSFFGAFLCLQNFPFLPRKYQKLMCVRN